MSIINREKIRSDELFNEIYRNLVEKYGRSSFQNLTVASPFVQVLHALTELSELNFLYIENAISELNIETAKNTENIFGLASLVGHNPYRGSSARGQVKLHFKPNLNDFYGDYILVKRYSKIKCVNNNLTYMLITDDDYLRLHKNYKFGYELNIIEGEYETQQFISNGEPLQSYNVIANSLTDNNDITVTVNGEKYGVSPSLYDMYQDEKSVIIKTGLNGGVSIFFGNGSFGYVPETGSLIQVTYVKTIGEIGNLSTNENETYFEFEDSGLLTDGTEIDLNEYIYIKTIMTPTFGTNEENVEFTRKIAPYTSKNFVLLNPSNYYYFLKKFNYFSVIDVYNTIDDLYVDDDNIIYAFLIPDISKKVGTAFSYFTLDESEFYLNENEKKFILKSIDDSGQQAIGSEFVFINPLIKRYAINIVFNYYDTANLDYIKSEINSKLNQYFLKFGRRDVIPRSDLITLIKTIDGIDSSNVYFISEENETAIKNGYYTKKEYIYNTDKGLREWTETKTVYVKDGEDPNLGFNEYGDIVIEREDLPLIRGGWYDRNGRYYSNNFSDQISAVNIFPKDKIRYTVGIKDTIDNFNLLKNNLQ